MQVLLFQTKTVI